MFLFYFVRRKEFLSLSAASHILCRLFKLLKKKKWELNICHESYVSISVWKSLCAMSVSIPINFSICLLLLVMPLATILQFCGFWWSRDKLIFLYILKWIFYIRLWSQSAAAVSDHYLSTQWFAAEKYLISVESFFFKFLYSLVRCFAVN